MNRQIAHIRNLNRIFGGDPDKKIFMMLDFAGRDGDVADPWYTGDFDATWRDVLEGCHGLFRTIISDPEYSKELSYAEDDWEDGMGETGLIHDDFPRG
jgi:protein-tyrosine phosphatase